MSTQSDLIQAFFRGWSQHDRFLWLTTPLGADKLVAESLQGWESLDRGGFRFQLTALTERPDLPLDKLIGASVLIEWQVADGQDARRPFHGHVTAAERVGYNGGLARVRLVVEPWLALLHQRVDSYNFVNASVVEISEQIFAHYARGAIAPAWRWALADPAKYANRSLTAQAGESDFAFLERLWAEEGIFYWFEHQGDAHSTDLGKHTLVLADTNQRFAPAEPEVIGFHQTSDGDPRGGIRQFMNARRWRIGSVARASWDHRSLSTRPSSVRASGAVAPGEDRDVAGPYAFQTAAIGDQRAQQQLDAQRVAALQTEGSGTRRDLRPGLRFAMSRHPSLDPSRAFVCLRVEHDARANVSADVHGAIAQRLGAIPPGLDIAPGEPGDAQALHAAFDATTYAGGALVDGDEVYRNRFAALPFDQAYRPLAPSGHGARVHPVAVMPGAQTSIVVGAGDPVHTERDHRIRIQHHAQRGQNSASRDEHPRAANAPADRGAGTWTRMVTSIGGDNWGGVSVPRVGQEVWTEWLEGQPDRPVAVAALYNGQGNADAQHNALAGGPSGSTANAAAWFAGNDHAAVLTGFKTQDLNASQTGAGGSRQFMLDDTAGQSSARLYTTDHGSGLTLGHINQVQDNRRLADRGYGAELSTQAAAALRAGAGLLISTAPGVNQMDASAASQVLAQQREMLQGLAKFARKQGAEPGASTAQPDGVAPAGDTTSPLVAIEGLQQSQVSLGATREGSGASGAGGGAVAWQHPHLVAHGAAGVAALTAQSHVWTSGTQTVLSAGRDVQVTVQGKSSIVAKEGIALYTHGTPGGSRPVPAAGIALHAATGAVTVQAQNGGTLDASAQRAVTVSSAKASVALQSPKRLLLTAANAFLKMEGNDIVIGAPGKATFHAAQHTLTGPRSANVQLPSMNKPACVECMRDLAHRHEAIATRG
ncbi:MULTISPECIES: type VI secretion system Vgr family protein [Burkholderia]|uniref:Type VI secretion system tip protein VgrG n=3 Tax=Burkholderia cenocepacia TaxID=95486 RepID=A0ABD4UFB4_9BURK|nr:MULTISPECIES: type VI secretion system tip protein VgrG [Burkholderia]AQQ19994.1 type IV secretion protein Rhs [Burkholderia cenocepacia]MCW3539063.1 type VI secretion system tip protein VgrG [Burkholderia cenocepacia]MCW3696199.1 type VI secretion system tip protein VgrG [Burkholderia cenocepacia]MCW3705915.1 type VI secretion system tip protein VgrG [Burkholderia cenocepacia]MCW3713063.1 type VI secretion system tip protein VgrG [Burkholderia cenocepacia]